MKQLYLLLFLLVTFAAEAQVIRYDTISVAPGDSRNIHRSRALYLKPADESIYVENSQPAKNEPLRFDRRKLRFGADLGFSLSRNYTRLGIGPQAGYQFNQYLMAGAGIKYYYTRAATPRYVIRNNLLGANLFGYLYPARFIALFAQPELNYIHSKLEEKTAGNRESSSGMVPSLVVGAGLRVGRSHITLNYDLVQHVNSPHPEGFYLGVSAFF